MSKQCTFTCDKCGKQFTYKQISFSADYKDMKK